MDYREEQANEIEVLQSIYCGELEILGTDPHRFCIKMKSDHDEEKEEGLACTLKFTFTDRYPDEPPVIEVLELENLEKEDEEEFLSHLTGQANENLGMVMVFTIVSAAEEWLSSRWDLIKQNKEMEAERRLRESEEEEMRRFEGTRVTVETFMAWKKAFEEEIGFGKKDVEKEKEARKLTGRELFLQDETLIESDLMFLEDARQTLKVDESLFQDLDELELGEETELLDD